ncbi:GDSL lipase/esterase [Mycena crocata]|nr:GDSL lipase/esterase [Mycena crocata]
MRPVSLSSSFLCLATLANAKLTWNRTQFLFVFGDSYTATGFNISAGVDSAESGRTSSNGPNWVQTLSTWYNVAGTKVFNMACPGATIDSAIVPPHLPTTLSVVDQVTQFTKVLAEKPPGTPWTSSNSLFAIWIGINDCTKSFNSTNTTHSEFSGVLMNRLSTQIDELYSSGARSFLFLTVPPINRAPRFMEQDSSVRSQLTSAISTYNIQLSNAVDTFAESHPGFEGTVFDTHPVFNTLLDNAETLGFFNSTGYCEAYINGTASHATEIPPCSAVSNYFWLNSLHPLFTVHDILAHAISTTLRD